MATRGEIRDSVYEEMVAVSGTYDVVDADGNTVDTATLDAEDISLRSPEDDESHPQIVYHDNYVRVTYNGVGKGPDMVTYDADGNVDEEIWREYIEAQFIIDVRASAEDDKEPIYEALRSRFGQYEHDPWDETDIHDDVIDVRAMDAQTVDTGDAEHTIRGDQLEIRVEFHRDYTFSTDIIEGVNTSVDADDDGEYEYTYQTN